MIHPITPTVYFIALAAVAVAFGFIGFVTGIHAVAKLTGHDPAWTCVDTEELLNLTAELDEHPPSWDYPCACAECRSLCDEDETEIA